MSRISKSERIELWLDRLQRQAHSNQTIAQFCAVEGVSAPSFYQWKRRLETRLAERLETEVASTQPEPAAFSEIQIVGQASPASITLPGGIQIQLGSELCIAAAIVDRVLQHACPNAPGTASAKLRSC